MTHYNENMCCDNDIIIFKMIFNIFIIIVLLIGYHIFYSGDKELPRHPLRPKENNNPFLE